MDDSRIQANEDPLFRLKPVLVTGATGCVGGRLVPRLLEAGYRVRVMSRSMEKLSSRLWADQAMLEAVRAGKIPVAERGADNDFEPRSTDFEIKGERR